MGCSTIDQLPKGARVFVDSTIFVYHFAGLSPACRQFLSRCERNEVKALTSVVVLAEVSHRLMMMEAVATGKLSPGNLARKLRQRPEIIEGLSLFRQQVERIPLMGVEVVSLDLTTVLDGMQLCGRHGLMTNDAIVLASALATGTALASADRDFHRVDVASVYYPDDLLSGDE